MNTDKRSRDLTRAFPGDPDRLSLLHDRLAATAQQNRILDIAYRAIDSPVGPLPIAATEPGLPRRRRRQAHPAHPGSSSMNPPATQPGRPVSLPDR